MSLEWYQKLASVSTGTQVNYYNCLVLDAGQRVTGVMRGCKYR